MTTPRVIITVQALNMRGDDAHCRALMESIVVAADLDSMGLEIPADSDVTTVAAPGTIRRVIYIHVTASLMSMFPVPADCLASLSGDISEIIRLRTPTTLYSHSVVWEPVQ